MDEYRLTPYKPGGYCGVSYQNSKKEDCFYYFGEKDMGATIPCCKKRRQLGDCPCEHCEDYISGSDAYRIVEEWQKAKKEAK